MTTRRETPVQETRAAILHALGRVDITAHPDQTTQRAGAVACVERDGTRLTFTVALDAVRLYVHEIDDGADLEGGEVASVLFGGEHPTEESRIRWQVSACLELVRDFRCAREQNNPTD